jgi:hypothetical protein
MHGRFFKETFALNPSGDAEFPLFNFVCMHARVLLLIIITAGPPPVSQCAVTQPQLEKQAS